jgi:hypothetical protein
MIQPRSAPSATLLAHISRNTSNSTTLKYPLEISKGPAAAPRAPTEKIVDGKAARAEGRAD